MASGEAREARVLRKLVHERTRLNELTRGREHGGRGREEQPVVLEERTARGLRNGAEFARVGREGLRELVGGGVGELGRVGFDDHEQRACALREGLVLGFTERGPLRAVLNETADVGIDLEMPRDVHAAEHGKHDRKCDDPRRAAYRPGDEANDEWLQHTGEGALSIKFFDAKRSSIPALPVPACLMHTKA